MNKTKHEYSKLEIKEKNFVGFKLLLCNRSHIIKERKIRIQNRSTDGFD